MKNVFSMQTQKYNQEQKYNLYFLFLLSSFLCLLPVLMTKSFLAGHPIEGSSFLSKPTHNTRNQNSDRREYLESQFQARSPHENGPSMIELMGY
jgi:hypothetical protein